MEEEKTKQTEKNNRRFSRKPRIDDKVRKAIKYIEETLVSSIQPLTIRELNGYQRKAVLQHFEHVQEYRLKTYREKENVIMKVYPVGQLKRLAEQKTQEVLMKGKFEALPPMGSFERFVIHDYLKEREGIKTESFGEEGKSRHVEIHPLFGRALKKAKKRLTR